MRAAVLFLLAGLMTLSLSVAAKIKKPIFPLLDKSDDSDSSVTVVVPTDNDLYVKYVCQGNPDGLKLIVPGSCSEYYECFNGVTTLNYCTGLTQYDPISQTCVSAYGCVERSIEIEVPAGCSGVCCGKNAGLYVDPTNKAQFYFCNKNVGILHSCCNEEQFNPITKACDVAANCPE